MSAISSSDASAPAMGGYEILQVIERDRGLAAQRLVAGATDDPVSGGKRFLAAAKLHGIELRHLWGSVERVTPGMRPGAFRQVCLAVPGIGNTAMFFTSPAPTAADQVELSAVIRRAAEGLGGGRLGQVLLDTDDRSALEAYRGAGFTVLTDLLYMRRGLRTPAWPSIPKPPIGGLHTESWDGRNESTIIDVMERTYEGTLDCPELCGLRRTRDVYESHRSVGSFDPDFWWIIQVDDQALGLALLNPSPELDSVELVYLGLAQELRGKGVARWALAQAGSAASSRRESWLTCAVDARNFTARKLYEALGFSEFARRVAMVRIL